MAVPGSKYSGFVVHPAVDSSDQAGKPAFFMVKLEIGAENVNEIHHRLVHDFEHCASPFVTSLRMGG